MNTIELEERVSKLEDQIKESNKHIGKYLMELGTYTEHMLMPSIEKILIDQLEFDSFYSNFQATKNGDHLEIDAFAFTNDPKGPGLIVEVKTKLRSDDIKQLERIIKKIPTFFPEHKDRKFYGMFAALSCDSRLKEKLHSKGIYLATIANDMVSLQIPKGFNAKALLE